MSEQRRGIIMAVAGIVVLAANVIDAVNRGSSALNIIAIATGAFLLFYGFIVIGRSGSVPRDDDSSVS
jgi:hypothetical protein